MRGARAGGERGDVQAGKRRPWRPGHCGLTIIVQWGVLFSTQAEKAARASLPGPPLPPPLYGPLETVLSFENSHRRTCRGIFVLCFSCCSLYWEVLPSDFAQSHCLGLVLDPNRTAAPREPRGLPSSRGPTSDLSVWNLGHQGSLFSGKESQNVD